jgi:hypothetical protein
MPPEILSTIVDLAGPESLPALRLTNKYLCVVSNTPFATLHFSERRHVQSAYSMDALIDITAHPFFGKFVKTVIISGSRPEPSGSPLLQLVPPYCTQCFRKDSSPLCENPAPHHTALSFEQLRGKLREAFSNIARLSSPVYIGFRDSGHKCFGSQHYHADCTMISGIPSYLNTFLSRRDDCRNFIETYKETLQAAQESGCEVGGTKLFTSRACMPTRHTIHDEEVRNMTCYLLRSLSGTSSFELSLIMTQFGPRWHLKYDHNSGELELSGFDFEGSSMGFPEEEAAHLLFRLQTRSMVQVTLKTCWLGKPSYLRVFPYSALAKLMLHDVTLYTENFDTNLWSSLLDQLARTTHLKYLEMHRCQYEFSDANDQDSETYDGSILFQLPSGKYQTDPELFDVPWLWLAPSGDLNKKIVLSDRTSISPQLKELADQVAQLEVEKVARIEREGWVRTDIVGIEPDDDDIYDEDDTSDEDDIPDEDDSSDAESVSSEQDHGDV